MQTAIMNLVRRTADKNYELAFGTRVRFWPDLAAFATHFEPSAMRQNLFAKELTSTGVGVQDVERVSFFARGVRLEPLDLVDEL